VHVGIDVSSVKRFENWYQYSDASLKKIFTNSEVTKYRSIKNKFFACQFLASRFAVKEASFKALSGYCDVEKLAVPKFLATCRLVSIEKTVSGVPKLCLNFDSTHELFARLETSVSISHERCHSAAVVLLLNAKLISPTTSLQVF
jgi:phosphopantetheine--protein transferase-like protein